tara:strand:+ start:50085 stop:52037 length:1953 start_codon:yes stop_codon:yes gene_type:complete
MKNFSLDQLTEGIRQRHLGSQNRRLVEKWARTGLLRGLDGVKRENMSRMLENQAGQVLREQSSISTGGGAMTSSGDLRGFSNIAFPIVRRVFGGLVANELVSIQPMSLPSGLLFYLDYTYGSTAALPGNSQGAAVYASGTSIYNEPTGKGVQSGSLGIGGQYNLAGSGYSRVYDSAAMDTADLVVSGAYGDGSTITGGGLNGTFLRATGSDGKLLQFDPQLTSRIEDVGGPNSPASYIAVLARTANFDASGDSANGGVADWTMVKDFGLYVNDGVAPVAGGTGFKFVTNVGANAVQASTNLLNVRRLNQIGTWDGTTFTPDAMADPAAATTALLMICSGNGVDATHASPSFDSGLTLAFPVDPALSVGADGDTLTIPAFESNFGATPSPAIPDIDIKVESLAVTAVTRKLRARWSPELAQDLNAYHSLDAEVELTQILSEQIALEIDREILNDLLTQAKTQRYWSRAPGKFVNRTTGIAVDKASSLSPGPAFTGTVREWYETLVETIIDVANEIHRLTLRGSANFIVVSPDVATMLEASVLYRPAYTLDGEGQVSAPFSLGAEKVGTLSNRFTVYKDPYFPRNKVLVGFKGGSYLETGYVYAPYVPLIVTPTIFAPEDFTPRKGVMTRYGKKMVRSDFYGTVTVLDLNII